MIDYLKNKYNINDTSVNYSSHKKTDDVNEEILKLKNNLINYRNKILHLKQLINSLIIENNYLINHLDSLYSNHLN